LMLCYVTDIIRKPPHQHQKTRGRFSPIRGCCMLCVWQWSFVGGEELRSVCVCVLRMDMPSCARGAPGRRIYT
jgi:hypothetical protein